MNLDECQLPYIEGEGVIGNVIQSAKWILENAQLFKDTQDNQELKCKVASRICFDALQISHYMWRHQFVVGSLVSFKDSSQAPNNHPCSGTIIEISGGGLATIEYPSPKDNYEKRTIKEFLLNLTYLPFGRRENDERMERIHKEMEAYRLSKLTNK